MNMFIWWFSRANNEYTEQNIGMVFCDSHKACSRACTINGKYNLNKAFSMKILLKNINSV